MNWGFGFGGMKSCENCSTYFITKDAKLCKSVVFPFLNAHSLYFFFYSLLPLYFLFCMFCMIYNQTTFLPHVFNPALIFLSSCQSVSDL